MDNTNEIVVNEEVNTNGEFEELSSEKNNEFAVGLAIGAVAAIATGALVKLGKKIGDKTKPARDNFKSKIKEKRVNRKASEDLDVDDELVVDENE